MSSFKHEYLNDDEIAVSGASGQRIATIEKRSDDFWHIVKNANWVHSDGYDLTPSKTAEEALKKLDAA